MKSQFIPMVVSDEARRLQVHCKKEEWQASTIYRRGLPQHQALNKITYGLAIYYYEWGDGRASYSYHLLAPSSLSEISKRVYRRDRTSFTLPQSQLSQPMVDVAVTLLILYLLKRKMNVAGRYRTWRPHHPHH